MSGHRLTAHLVGVFCRCLCPTNVLGSIEQRSFKFERRLGVPAGWSRALGARVTLPGPFCARPLQLTFDFLYCRIMFRSISGIDDELYFSCHSSSLKTLGTST